MGSKLKPLSEQVIVLTGASSGIGLATAVMAAEQGAKLVLAARSSETLDELVQEITAQGGQAIAVPADVTDRAQLEALAQAAVSRFGRIDTWINNAGIGMFGRLDETSEADARRLFDVNFWSVVNGSLIALSYLKQNGGALINLGSEVSEGSVALQGMYGATKHAVKGFNDALRIEVEEVDKAPVAVVLIQPQATDTPFPQHAFNTMDQEPKLPSPLIEPWQVAEAILKSATDPERFVKVGPVSKMDTFMAKFLPAAADKMGGKQAGRQQYDEPPRNPEGALYEASAATGVVGQTHGTGGREK
jgi:short-subunit dehydrogenase